MVGAPTTTDEREQVFLFMDEQQKRELWGFIAWYKRLYEDVKGYQHPYLKPEQIDRICECLHAAKIEYELDLEQLQAMAEGFIGTVKKSDHNLNHFATPGMLDIRYLANVYQREKKEKRRASHDPR